MGVDVIVVGLGSMGAATACQLAERGLRVVGLDTFTPPHDRGSHAGESRIIRMAYAEGADYVPLLRRAYPLWHELAERTGEQLISVTGGLMLGARDGAVVSGALASARAHGLAHELLDADQLRRRFPAFTPRDDEVGLYEEASGMLRPEAAIAAYLRLAGRAGADLRFGCEVLGWRADDAGVTVRTSTGDVSADRLVITPGAWAAGLLADLHIPFLATRRVQHFWHVPDADHAVGRLPIWIWEYASGLTAYGLPAIDAGSGSGPRDGRAGQDPATHGAKAALHHGHEPADPRQPAPPATPQEISDMRGWLAQRIPGFAAAGHWGARSCLYTLTPDEHFVLGIHPEHSNVSVAAGFSGHGFKFVPVVGEILADLSCTGRTAHPIGLFAPDRFG